MLPNVAGQDLKYKSTSLSSSQRAAHTLYFSSRPRARDEHYHDLSQEAPTPRAAPPPAVHTLHARARFLRAALVAPGRAPLAAPHSLRDHARSQRARALGEGPLHAHLHDYHDPHRHRLLQAPPGAARVDVPPHAVLLPRQRASGLRPRTGQLDRVPRFRRRTCPRRRGQAMISGVFYAPPDILLRTYYPTL